MRAIAHEQNAIWICFAKDNKAICVDTAAYVKKSESEVS